MYYRSTILWLAAAATAIPAFAAENSRPLAVQKVIDCRSIAAADARLACFDANVGNLESAIDRDDVTVVDRSQIEKSRASLFGLNIQPLAVFTHHGKGKPEDDELKQVTATVQAATELGGGLLLITLQDGARWQQTDDNMVARLPRSGSVAVIKRGIVGGFMMSIDGQPAIRVRRIN